MTPEHKAAIAEGKRKARERKETEHLLRSQANAAALNEAIAELEAGRGINEPFSHSMTTSVTYRPFDGDPYSTVWNGITFKANVPVELDRRNPAHQVSQLLPKQVTGQNGEILTKHAPMPVFMGDMAKGNPSFEVDGNRAMKRVNKRILPQAGHGWAEDHEDQIIDAW